MKIARYVVMGLGQIKEDFIEEKRFPLSEGPEDFLRLVREGSSTDIGLSPRMAGIIGKCRVVLGT